MRGIAKLPFRWQLRLGRGVGRILLRLQRRQRRIAARNIDVCFPELSDEARAALLRQHFESLGLSIVEMSLAWFGASAMLRQRVSISGREHLDAALASGNGVLLVMAHFTMLELGAAALESIDAPITCLYRPQGNALMDATIVAGRARFSRSHIPRDNVRALLRRLRANDIVLYLPDQTHIGNQSMLLPFFGEPAQTNIATSKLAAMSGAHVLTYFFRRLPGEAGYEAEIRPLDSFPGDDAQTDAAQLFGRLEAFIRVAPEQYLWTYKKFKRRPPPLPDIYAEPR